VNENGVAAKCGLATGVAGWGGYLQAQCCLGSKFRIGAGTRGTPIQPVTIRPSPYPFWGTQFYPGNCAELQSLTGCDTRRNG
jgi:hypothetical protein